MQGTPMGVRYRPLSPQEQSHFFQPNIRNPTNWNMQQRNMFISPSMCGSSSEYTPTRKICRFDSQEGIFSDDLAKIGVPDEPLNCDGFITQVDEGFSTTDMFLVGEEELSTAEQPRSQDLPTQQNAQTTYSSENETQGAELGQEETSTAIKQEETNIEEETEEARALRIKEKNRIAAKICRRRKKEYIRCLEQRVASLEKQNEALILKLKFFQDIYEREHNPFC